MGQYKQDADLGRRLSAMQRRLAELAIPSPLTGSLWVAPTLINSWGNVGAGFETAGYLKDPFGFVHLKGLIVGGANGSVALVLPPGYIPGESAQRDLSPGGGIGIAVIDTSGNVTVSCPPSTNMSLGAVTPFLAEN